MGRLILVGLIVVLVLWLLRRALAAGRRPDPPTPAELVCCAHCGLNLPRAEARSAGGHHYCSEEHWRLGPRKD
jgi:uncharacterized protein